MAESPGPEQRQEFLEAFWQPLQPGSADIGVLKPVDLARVILRRVNRCLGVEPVQFQHHPLGAADAGQPVANNGDFQLSRFSYVTHERVPLWNRTTQTVLARITRSLQKLQFWT